MFSYYAKMREALIESPPDAIFTELPMPSRPAQPAAPTYPDLPPVQNWSHPFNDTSNPLLQLTQLAKATSGHFPLGRNGLWHGGVHFDGGTAGTLDQSSVRCLADGEVVAYRIDDTSPKTSFLVNKLAVPLPASRNFVLVRHRLQLPMLQGSTDKPPSLVFYSLYMHLQDWADYQNAPDTQRPAFWAFVTDCRVSEKANDLRPTLKQQTANPQPPMNERGARVRSYAQDRGAIGFLPRGTLVTVSGEDHYLRLQNTLGPAHLLDADGAVRGYVAHEFLRDLRQGEHRVAVLYGPLNVRAEPSMNSEVIGELPHGTQVAISGEGAFRKLERINQYIAADSLDRVREPQAQQRTVLIKPVPIKAGELIGHIGLYQDIGELLPDKKLHLEVFSRDNVPAFIKASRAWAERLPEHEKSWLYFPKGTAVIAQRKHFAADQPPSTNWPHSESAAPLSVPRSLIDGLPADKKIQAQAVFGKAACTWYYLEGLFHDAERNLLDGWVCDQADGVHWHSPWAWKDWEVVFNTNSREQLLACQLRSQNKLDEQQLTRFCRMADKGEHGPLKTALRKKIDLDDSKPLTPDELQQALRVPAYAQLVAKTILFSESEWKYLPVELSALDKLTSRSEISPNQNWEAQKERIKAFDWMTEAGERLGLPGHGQMYHFHPVGFVSLFRSGDFIFTLEIMKTLYPKLKDDQVSDLLEIAMELNTKLRFFKLDTALRRTHFFAQILEETGDVLAVEEDFTYSASALKASFRYFSERPDEADAHGYLVKEGKIKKNGAPMNWWDFMAIANGAYGNRRELGNGGHSSGDGWNFRGRGLKQLTGRANYSDFNGWHRQNQHLWPNDVVDFIEKPESLTSMKYAARSAAYFWLKNRLYEIADMGPGSREVDLITDRVNRHTGSRDDRKEFFLRLWSAEVLK